MKAITLTQPWATLVAIGAKQIETRGWSTNYRGPLAIHAAKGIGPVGGACGLMSLCRSEPFRSTLLSAGILGTPALPRGAIVAVCEVKHCIRIDEGLISYNNPGVGWWVITEQERAFGDYAPGRYAWLLGDVRALPAPIPYKGALSLWEWDRGDT